MSKAGNRHILFMVSDPQLVIQQSLYCSALAFAQSDAEFFATFQNRPKRLFRAQ
jgi:hypothetical protein